jgi:ABC-type multidrug transport system fused ATPase/permease subunit
MLTLIRGSIVIDDINLTTVSPDIVRERLVTVSQKLFIMIGCTVRFNLDPTGILPDGEKSSRLSTELGSGTAYYSKEVG